MNHKLLPLGWYSVSHNISMGIAACRKSTSESTAICSSRTAVACAVVLLVERQRSSSSLNLSSYGPPCEPVPRSRPDAGLGLLLLLVVFAGFALPVEVLVAESFLEDSPGTRIESPILEPKVDMILFASARHLGHSAGFPASLIGRINSNSFWHVGQKYSYTAIRDTLPDLYGSVHSASIIPPDISLNMEEDALDSCRTPTGCRAVDRNSRFEILISLWHTGLVAELDFGSVLLIAIGLSADCFAVALGASTSAKGSWYLQMLRVSLAFGVSQAVMPVLGWLAGKTLVNLISDYDHWVAFALLLIIGGRMIWESCHSKESEAADKDFSRGLTLLTLAVATSIDALAVGLSFAFLRVNIAMAVLTIGGVAFLITGVGFLAGRKAGKLLGERAETLGGIILIGIGIRILLTHLL